MARAKIVKHIITIGTEKFSLRAPDIYANLGSATGITKAPTPDNTNYAGKIGSYDFASGKVVRLKARGTRTEGSTTYSREFTIVTTPDKEKAAIAGLDSKQITADSKTWDLVGARVPQRRRFS
jgi:hypothetical protein